MERRLSIRKVLVSTLVTTALSAIVLSPSAAADPGDRTINYNEHGVELATDACPGAFGQMAVRGFPNGPDDYQVNFGGVGCTVHARFVGVKADGRTVVDTGYRTVTGNDGFLGLLDVYRCHIEFGVQRQNGSFYTRTIVAEPQENPNCPE